jgi:hypothetical protein
VTGTYDGNLCRLPCSICLCEKEKLSSTKEDLQYRTEAAMKDLYHEMVDKNRTDRMDLSKEFSLHPVQVIISNIVMYAFVLCVLLQ